MGFITNSVVRHSFDRVSPRQFSRRFTAAFGQTAAQQVEDLRLDDARSRLTSTAVSVDAVGAAVGFRSADAFRRAFDRRFGLSPSDYRRRFASANGLPGDTHAHTADR